MSAITYTDDMLKNLEASLKVVRSRLPQSQKRSLIGALQGFLDIVTANRAELKVPEHIEHSKRAGSKRAAGRTVHRVSCRKSM